MENQCTAHSSRTGERCKKAAIEGGSVCRTHGGAAPQVREKAQQRILAMVNPALAELRKLIGGADSESVKLSAIKDVLDRAGVGAKQAVEITGKDGKPLLDIASVRAYCQSVTGDTET